MTKYRIPNTPNWSLRLMQILYRLDDGDVILVPHQTARETLEKALKRDKPECLVFIELPPKREE